MSDVVALYKKGGSHKHEDINYERIVVDVELKDEYLEQGYSSFDEMLNGKPEPDTENEVLNELAGNVPNESDAKAPNELEGKTLEELRAIAIERGIEGAEKKQTKTLLKELADGDQS